MKITIIALCLFMCAIGITNMNGQNATLEANMKKGFDMFTDGESFDQWLEGAEIMSQVGKEYPNDWLPEYWACYFYTQLTFAVPKEDPPKGISGESVLIRSQKNLDMAKKKVKNMNPEIRSDFHMLQALIYDFNNWSTEDEMLKMTFSEKSDKEVEHAIRLNPNSPLIDVVIATKLIKKKDIASVYAGRILLLYAKQKFITRMTPRYMSSHWSEQWVDTWLNSAQKGIKALTSEKK